MSRTFAALALFSLLSALAHAESFRTEAKQEATVRAIATKLRCPVCQSENILDSQSGTAQEILAILREQLAQGRSETEIINFFRSRYGDYVLLTPPTSGFGSFVWAAPLIIMVAGLAAYLLLLRHSARASGQRDNGVPTREPLTERGLEGLEL